MRFVGAFGVEWRVRSNVEAAMDVQPSYDVFLSYHHADQVAARRLLAALHASKVKVFFDENDVEDFESISARLSQGVSRSKALLALYSVTYPTRRACQFELTAAFVAGQGVGDPRARVLVINPSQGIDHIQPVELRDALFRVLPEQASDAEVEAAAIAVARHVRRLTGLLGAVRRLDRAPWRGRRPVGSPTFVGRIATLWEIHSQLHESDLRPITGAVGPGVAQIVGLAGVGKTMLAEEYALRFGSAYPAGVFWLNAPGGSARAPSVCASDRASWINGLAAERIGQIRGIAAELGVPVEILADPSSVEGALVQELERRGGLHLWVVDNVPEGLDGDELREWFAPHRLGKTLLTTRGRDYRSLATFVEPGVLGQDDAVKLLTQLRPPDGPGEIEEAVGLAAELGFHPLALAVAGAAMVSGGESPYAEFRADLREPDEDVLEFAAELADVLPTGHNPSIAKTLLGSIGGLDQPGIDLLRLSSYLASAPIPTFLVDGVFATADDLAETAARRRGARGRHEAQRASLAECYGSEGAQTVHPLVARTVRFTDHDKRGRGEELRRAAVRTLIRDLTDQEAVRSGDIVEALIAHARHLADSSEPVELELLAILGGYDLERGALASAREFFEKVVTGRREALGEQHSETLAAMEGLATVLRAQGEFNDALRLQEQVFTRRRDELGEDHVETLDALVQVASTLYARGDRGEARQIEEKVLVLRRDWHGEQHPDTLEAMENLSLTIRALGDLDGALELQVLVLRGRQELFGDMHRYTLAAMANMAWTLHLKGKVDAARQLEERVLAGRLELFGEVHPETFKAMGNLGSTLEAQGQLDDALGLETKMVESQRKLFGERHPDTLKGMINLSQTLRKIGDLAGARDVQERVVAGRIGILGEQHPDTLRAKSSLAKTMADQGELVAARELFERVLVEQVGQVGEGHFDTLLTVEGLAATLHKLNEPDLSLKLQRRSIELRSEFQGEDHPETLYSVRSLALMMWERGQRDEANELAEYLLAKERELRRE
jgi:tetratricopeptide (TPR) repeat protein